MNRRELLLGVSALPIVAVAGFGGAPDAGRLAIGARGWR